MLQRLKEVQKLRRKRGGRPRTSDAVYIGLLQIWEADVAARPDRRVKVRVAELMRRDVPAKLGLKFGKRSDAHVLTTFLDALARGRWARLCLAITLAERRNKRSLLDTLDASRAIEPPRGWGGGFVKFVAVSPARIRTRIRSD